MGIWQKLTYFFKWRYVLVRPRYAMLALVLPLVWSLAVAATALVQYVDFSFMHTTPAPETATPFPIGVDPIRQEISEVENVEAYVESEFALPDPEIIKTSWLERTIRILVQLPLYQHVASLQERVLVIWPGDRYEQVVDHFGDILSWNTEERTRFQTLVQTNVEGIDEGMFYPGKYRLPKDATPEAAAALVNERFDREIRARYNEQIASRVRLQDALIIASLLEREADSFAHMREISGVIWNRLFIDMELQLDATLQYAKGSSPHVTSWWPPVRPEDKFIESPFNTYANEGLPPAPISNASMMAVLAALNPKKTDCLFYFHTANDTLYCSPTYEAHRDKLIELYGQGR